MFPRQEPPELDPDATDIDFQILDWYIPENDKALQQQQRANGYPREGEPPRYDIYMFGATAQGHSVCAKVTGFCPYFFVKLPPAWQKLSKGEMKVKVQELKQKLLHEKVTRYKMNGDTYMATIVPWRLQEHLEYMKLVWRKDFWGFTNGKEFPFIKIRMQSLALYNSLKRYFAEPAQIEKGFALYESNIDPFLRFIHERNIDPCGWVRLPRGSYDILEDEEGEALSRCGYNVTITYEQVEALSVNQIAPLLIASFDIECTSSHGDFPVARKDYRKLAADLVLATRTHTSKLTVQTLEEWILLAFDKTNPGTVIQRVYPKVSLSTEKLRSMIKPILYDLLDILQTSAKDIVFDDSDDEAEESDEIVAKAGAFTNAARDRALQEIVQILGTFDEKTGRWKGILPEVKGDPLIQIGTTVHRYGSDEIVYRHIASLKSCDPIEGADVECFASEDEVILGWKDMLQRLDPDILTGYNIFGFDTKYLYERACEVGVDETLLQGLGRLRKRQTIMDEKKLSSSALGDNIMHCFDLDGVVQIDMLKVMQRDHKLDSYKLDHVAMEFLKDQKDDLKPNEIFEKFKGTATDRCVIARYCLQDCALVNRLIHKLKVLENNVGMGNVCSVPLSYLFMRGQGVKIFSLVAKECRSKQYLIPVLKSARDQDVNPEEEGYEGAIVLNPQEGIYLDDPVTVLDYSSLYPSSMIERNLSHDCFVQDPAYDNLPGMEYITVSYDIYSGKGDKKQVTGKNECRFAQLPGGQKGIIPSILMKLLHQRKTTRKKIEYETLELADGRVAVGLVKELEDGQLEIMNVDQADLGKGFGGHKAIIAADQVVKRTTTFTSFEQAVLDALQLAYKITANSLYGQIGARTSPIFWKDIAASTTATGRERIMMAKNFAEKEYNAEIVYGDSVTGDTPLLVRYPNGMIDVRTIEMLSENWVEYENFRPWDSRLTEKEQAGFEGEVWSNGKWTKVIRVIRHKCNKKIYRVNTFRGCIDVTEDHSLIAKNGTEIKPTDCVLGETEILHTYPTEYPTMSITLPRYVKQGNEVFNPNAADDTLECTKCNTEHPSTMYYYSKKGKRNTWCKLCIKQRACERQGKEFNGVINKKILTYNVPDREISNKEAWVMGFFFADGSCGNYKKTCQKISWAINNQNLDFLHTAMDYLHETEPKEIVTFKILDTMDSSGVYKLVAHGSIHYMVEKYRPMFYDKDDYKKVPAIILNASLEIRKSFLQGYLTGDGCKEYMEKEQGKFSNTGKIGSMGLYYIAKSVGYQNIRVNIRKDKPDVYTMTTITDNIYFEENKDKVMKVWELSDGSNEEVVYDIETSEGRFGGGVGETTLSNTDSIFVKFPIKSPDNKKLGGMEKLAISIAMGQKMSKEIKRIMPPPQSLEYEKTFWPFILFSKKRYVGNLYEDDPNKKPKQKSMGIVLKRRDNAPIVKKIFGGCIDYILNKQDLQASVEFLKNELQNLVDGKCDLKELVITKTLKAEYKDPTKIAHKVLAERMGERDAGNKPAINERIPFVYIKTPPGVEIKLQGDRIEHPDYIREQNLTPDYRFYMTNQIMKPVCQLYALCVEQLPGYQFPPEYWMQIDIELSEHRLYTDEKKRKDRIQALRMKEVEALLFQPYLDQLPDTTAKKKTVRSTTKKTYAAAPLENAVNIMFTIREMKRGKQYRITGTAGEWSEQCDMYLTKVAAYRNGIIELLEKYLTNFKDTAALSIHVEKPFLRAWKQVLEKKEQMTQDIAKALERLDVGQLKEIQETQKMLQLTEIRIPFELHELPIEDVEAEVPAKKKKVAAK